MNELTSVPARRFREGGFRGSATTLPAAQAAGETSHGPNIWRRFGTLAATGRPYHQNPIGMPLTPTLLLVPSVSAGQILLRRLAREKRAMAAISAMRPKDLAQKMAEGKCHALRPDGLAKRSRRAFSPPSSWPPSRTPQAGPARGPGGPRSCPDARGSARGRDETLAVRRLGERSQSPEDRSRLLGVAAIYERYTPRSKPGSSTRPAFTPKPRPPRRRFSREPPSCSPPTSSRARTSFDS